MLSAALIILIVSLSIVIVGGRSYLPGKVAVCIVGSAFVAVATGLVTDAMDITRLAWQGPLLVLLPLPVLAAYLAYVGTQPPLTLRDGAAFFRRMFAERRRHSSVRADVRRQVRQYKIEVD